MNAESKLETVAPPQRGISRDQEVAALLRRAHIGALAAGLTGSESNLRFWKGYAKACRDIGGGTGLRAAERDARAQASAEDQPQTGLEAARAALAERLESLTLAEVQQILAAQGIEISPDAVVNVDVGARQVLEDDEVARVHGNDEHAVSGVDVGHGADSHSANVADPLAVSLRDQFAMRALPALLHPDHWVRMQGLETDAEESMRSTARLAYVVADLMLAERPKRNFP